MPILDLFRDIKILVQSPGNSAENFAKFLKMRDEFYCNVLFHSMISISKFRKGHFEGHTMNRLNSRNFGISRNSTQLHV